jgi:hypothetical protein
MHISTNIAQNDEETINFENEYKTTPLIIKALDIDVKDHNILSHIKDTSNTGFKILTESIKKDEFIIQDKNINYMVFDLDRISRQNGIE